MKSKSNTNKSAKNAKREKDILKLKEKLLKRRQELLSEAESAIITEDTTSYPDTGDQASAEIERSFMLRLRTREQKLLQKINEAIEKIENGTFGICEDCGAEIRVKRLEARPVTTLCIDCKTAQEEEEKLVE